MFSLFNNVVGSVVGGVIVFVVYTGVLIIYRRLRPWLRIRIGKAEIHSKILLKPTLNWVAFIDGIDRLKEQLVCSSPKFIPDLFVGINLGGAAAAALLKSRGSPMAIFQLETQGDKREIRYSAFPSVLGQAEENEVPNTFFGRPLEKVKVLLVDEEFKTGNSAKVVIDCLTSKWGFDEKNIRIAVLALSEVEVRPLKVFNKAITIDQIRSVSSPKVNFSNWENKLLCISYLSPMPVRFPWEKWERIGLSMVYPGLSTSLRLAPSE